MTQAHRPLVVEPDQLQLHIGDPAVLTVDLSQGAVHGQYHVPGALHLDYDQIVTQRPPVMGLVPEARLLADVFSTLGLTPDTHVVAYDDEGGGKACRLLWTLAVLGHRQYSLLNGGLHAWVNENHPINNGAREHRPSHYPLEISSDPIADLAWIKEHLHDPRVTIVDARTPEEYSGADLRTQRGGHIPGAVNVEWTRAIDQKRHLRLKSEDDLRTLYEPLGVTSDKQVVVYCQTHHRSAHTWFVLRHVLGYPLVKGYPGSWSEWGNSADTPIE